MSRKFLTLSYRLKSNVLITICSCKYRFYFIVTTLQNKSTTGQMSFKQQPLLSCFTKYVCITLTVFEISNYILKAILLSKQVFLCHTFSKIKVSISLLAVALQALAYPSESLKKRVWKSWSRTVTRVSRPPPGKAPFMSAILPERQQVISFAVPNLISFVHNLKLQQVT